MLPWLVFASPSSGATNRPQNRGPKEKGRTASKTIKRRPEKKMNPQPSAFPATVEGANPAKPGPQHFSVPPSPEPTRRSQVVDEADRHSRKCLVCSHPERDAIDQGFLHWRSPANMALEFGVSAGSIYRHAHSTGLFARRAGKIRRSLEFIIEHAERCVPSADAIIRAIRLYACITDDGKWLEPPKQVIYTMQHASPPIAESAPPPPPPQASPQASSSPEVAPGANENLIENQKIKNPTQAPENKPHTKILIENSRPSSQAASHPQNSSRAEQYGKGREISQKSEGKAILKSHQMNKH
jgi:hypothetical protein